MGSKMTEEEREDRIVGAMLEDVVLQRRANWRAVYLNPYHFDLDTARKGAEWFAALVRALEAPSENEQPSRTHDLGCEYESGESCTCLGSVTS